MVKPKNQRDRCCPGPDIGGAAYGLAKWRWVGLLSRLPPFRKERGRMGHPAFVRDL